MYKPGRKKPSLTASIFTSPLYYINIYIYICIPDRKLVRNTRYVLYDLFKGRGGSNSGVVVGAISSLSVPDL